jgi:hypothetical protein
MGKFHAWAIPVLWEPCVKYTENNSAFSGFCNPYQAKEEDLFRESSSRNAPNPAISTTYEKWGNSRFFRYFSFQSVAFQP